MDAVNKLVQFDDFNCFALKVIDNLDVSEQTRQDYHYRIRHFLEFVRLNGFKQSTFLDYKRSLASKNNYSLSTKNKYLTTARIVLGEFQRMGWLPIDITKNIKSFKQSKKHKTSGFTQNEITQILLHTSTIPNSAKRSRIQAILALLIYQGLRQIEITRLNVTDVDLLAKQAFVWGKGRDDKEIIDLHPGTISILEIYLKSYGLADGPLFVCRSNCRKDKRLTVRGLRQIIKEVLIELDIRKNIHGFRHYFTTKLIETYHQDLLQVAWYTRHKNLEMLQVYNDRMKQTEDLPRYYQTFSNLEWNCLS